ncbi:hypothetical protein BDV59DRAFT_184054 [Aspergillus ambiguus]|uniref:uncharacterized protein n=1 Tax=Aspergillus ambiguus TaxID=176160 RepID=UPI003CCDC6AA
MHIIVSRTAHNDHICAEVGHNSTTRAVLDHILRLTPAVAPVLLIHLVSLCLVLIDIV